MLSRQPNYSWVTSVLPQITFEWQQPTHFLVSDQSCRSSLWSVWVNAVQKKRLDPQQNVSPGLFRVLKFRSVPQTEESRICRKFELDDCHPGGSWAVTLSRCLDRERGSTQTPETLSPLSALHLWVEVCWSHPRWKLTPLMSLLHFLLLAALSPVMRVSSQRTLTYIFNMKGEASFE